MFAQPAVAILHTLYGIYHLSRSPTGKPLGPQASYMLFASTFDLGLIPFYIFAAYIAYMEFTYGAYHWGTLLGNANEIPHTIANVTFLLSIINGALHAISFGISMFLAIVFRRITRLPPDLNPLEDNLTARPHKRTKSELAEKHHSHSTLDSGIGMDDPLMGTPRTIPFTMHARGDSYGDGPERLAPAPFPAYNENRQSQGPFVHPDQLPYGDLPPRIGEMPFEKARQQRNSIPRKPVQTSAQNTDDALRPTPPTHLDVPNQQLSPAHAPDRSESVSPMSDNWIAYPSRSPSPLENILKDNTPAENAARRDTSSIYSRSNTTASTNSAAKDWNTSSQRYGWDVGETITEDVRGEYESLAMHEFYGNDDDVQDYPQQNGLYDNTEQDLGDHPINIYHDHNEHNDDLDDLDDDDQELSASHPLNPLGLNPPTPQPSHGEHHEDNNNTSNPTTTTPSRHALTDIPNLSPNPRFESLPAGDSPTKRKTSRYYGELESNPSISIRRDTSNKGKPSRKQSKLTKTKSQKKKANSYGALRQDDHHSDNENYNDNDDLESEGFPSVDMNFGENDRKGRVVSNSGADIVSPRRSNPGVGTALSSYGSYIAGLGVGLGRRRDVSGKMAEEGRGGSIVNAGRPGTEPESKTPIRAAGWARFAGL